jgi:hypothetical protein
MQAIEFLKGALGALRGNRTFITCILALIYLIGCQWFGKVPDESILGIFAFLGLTFLRSAVSASGGQSGAVPTGPTQGPLTHKPDYHTRCSVPAQPIFSAAVAAIFAVLLLAVIFTPGCAMQRPYISERTETTNGVIQSRTVKSTAVALWPATSELAKGRLSAGKTLSVGVDGQALESGAGTNDVEVLRNLRAILGR